MPAASSSKPNPYARRSLRSTQTIATDVKRVFSIKTHENNLYLRESTRRGARPNVSTYPVVVVVECAGLVLQARVFFFVFFSHTRRNAHGGYDREKWSAFIFSRTILFAWTAATPRHLVRRNAHNNKYYIVKQVYTGVHTRTHTHRGPIGDRRGQLCKKQEEEEKIMSNLIVIINFYY